MSKYARTCSECKQGMNEGYIIEGGLYYYCSDDCLFKHMTKEQYQEYYEGNDSYWTTWDPNKHSSGVRIKVYYIYEIPKGMTPENFYYDLKLNETSDGFEIMEDEDED